VVLLNKVFLSSQVVDGGLSRAEQSYSLFYIPKVGGLCSKLELAVVLRSGGFEQEYHSLRFSSLAQFKALINNVIRAYVFFGRVEGLINPRNFVFKRRELLRFVDDCFLGDFRLDEFKKK